MTPLLSMLEAEHSKPQTMRIANWIGNDQEKFDGLVKLLHLENPKIAQRAAWPLSYCILDFPALANKHINDFIRLLDNSHQPAAVHRNIVKALANITIPKKYHGRLIDICMRNIAEPRTHIACQSYSLHILGNLISLYPEIKPEILTVIDMRTNAPAAFKSSAKRLMK